MLKQTIIKFKTRRLLKKRNEISTRGYASSKKIAIIASDAFENENSINNIIKELKNEGKEVSILFFCHNIKKTSTNLPHFHSGDITFSGKINNDDLAFLLDQHYDFALCFDDTRHYLIDYVFSQVKANCRVGISAPARNQLFDMMVQSTNEQIPLSQEVLKYVKMIQPYG